MVLLRARINEHIADPVELLDLIADPANTHTVQRCLPGYATPVLIYRQEDLQGLYLAGRELYRRIQNATTVEEVLALMHPTNVLPAQTYQRIATLLSGVSTTVVVYGPVEGGSQVYGPVEGGAVAYGYVVSSATDDATIEQFVLDQQGDNNEKAEQC